MLYSIKTEMPFCLRVLGYRCLVEFCKYDANLLVAVLVPELRTCILHGIVKRLRL
jgi:hypothetical protein